MNLLKKCSLLMVLMAAVMTVSAAACGNGPCLQHMVGEAIYLEEAPETDGIELLGNIGGAEEALAEGMRKMQESIDIAKYAITIEELDILMNRMDAIYPELFHLYGRYGYNYNSVGLVTKVNPLYTMTAEEYDEALEVYEQGVENIVDLVDNDWSDLEKILFVHDYLAVNFEYDTTYRYYDAYHFFQLKTGVCEAYTETFVAVMKELGIKVSFVQSEEINHIWNLVELNGIWYHLDVTHDDPTPDYLGFVSHSNFLLSTAGMLAEKMTNGTGSTGTGDWVFGVSDTIGDEYDTYFWQDAVSPFVEVDGVWYYLDAEGLKTWDGSRNGSASTAVAYENLRIDVVGGYMLYPDNPDIAGLSKYDGKLYYNSAFRVNCYDPETEENAVLETVDPAVCLIVGLRVDDGTLTYEVYFYPPEPEEGEAPQPGISEEYTLDIRPFIPMDHVYAYHAEDGKVEIKLENLPKDGKVLIVCYDGNGAFTGIQFCSESKVYDLPAGRISLLAMDFESGKPLCKKADL